MIRRTFLKRGLLAASAGMLGAPLAVDAMSIRPSAGTSLYVVTDQPDESMAAVEEWIGGFARGMVRVHSHPLAGMHVGDIALFRSGRLVDYRSRLDVDTSALRRLASRHELPRPIETPTLIQFEVIPTRGAGAGSATGADVFRDGVLVGSLPLSVDVEARRIESVHGHITVAIRNGRVRIVDASCRHKTCMSMGEIASPGQSLACIPARIAVTLDGISSIDAITL